MAVFMYRMAGRPAFDPPTTATFTDVPADNPYFNYVEWMNAEGISSGTTATTYSPSSPVTRAQMAVFMYRLAGSPAFDPPTTATFTDVPADNPYYSYAEWMNAEGISKGTTKTTYSPSSPVTREQMAALLYRLAAKSKYCAHYPGGVACTPGASFTWEPVPTISWPATVGQSLTAEPGVWIPARTVSYQWLRDGVVISGATASTYIITSADLQHKVAVSVLGTADGYADTTRTSPYTAVVAPTPPAPDLSIQTDLTVSGSGSGWHAKLVIQDGNTAISFGIQHQDRSKWAPCNGQDCLMFESVSNSPSYHDYQAPGAVVVTPKVPHTIRLDWYQAQGIAEGYCDGVLIGQVTVKPMSGQLVMSEEAVPALAGDYIDATFANVKFNPAATMGSLHVDSPTYAWAGTANDCWPGGTSFGQFTCTKTSTGFHVYGTATFAGCSGNNWDSCPTVGVRAWSTWNKK